eukprot:CAMPEP_0202943670 /NCGR_PEP_ID=MMETSP1395-20130829/4196_1 /ASSEMBLY_ACC=CAM_ASM_000871 /TAXON_ID=5961 /ORGANISM="Blepharisma japonicum, Strain Stock R1072" /LENGTH=62 /DNA_ID=CAMNT_0049641445 /DNA_START=643 /DNA_END=831 /DNA_ORIENTATION=-
MEQIYAELEIVGAPVSPAPQIIEEEPHEAQKKQVPPKKIEPKAMPSLVKQDSKPQELPKISV